MLDDKREIDCLDGDIVSDIVVWQWDLKKN
jgi:hypothetical protein